MTSSPADIQTALDGCFFYALLLAIGVPLALALIVKRLGRIEKGVTQPQPLPLQETPAADTPVTSAEDYLLFIDELRGGPPTQWRCDRCASTNPFLSDGTCHECGPLAYTGAMFMTLFSAELNRLVMDPLWAAGAARLGLDGRPTKDHISAAVAEHSPLWGDSVGVEGLSREARWWFDGPGREQALSGLAPRHVRQAFLDAKGASEETWRSL